MDIQYIFVLVIIFAAAGYAGSVIWRRSKSFAGKSDCGSDCGCGKSNKRSAISSKQ